MYQPDTEPTPLDTARIPAGGSSRDPNAYFPSLRGTVVEVMRLAGDPERSDEELFRVIAGDPSLSIQVLRFANSAAFRLESEVTSVARAVSVIGSRALRNIAICFAACESTPLDSVGEMDFAAFLEDSLRRGAAAELLARTHGMPDPEEAFTAGLLQDFGVVALIMREPTRGAEWSALRKERHVHRRELESAMFGRAHDEIGAELARRWQLPDTLAAVMCHHHKPEDTAGKSCSQLASMANMAETLADLFVAQDKQSVLAEAHSRLAAEYGLSGEAIDLLIGQIPARVEVYAQAMGIRISQQSSLQEVIDEIRAQNRLLVEMNLGYQQETWKLEQILREKEEIERELRLAKARLERLATTDPLTLLHNRRNFEINLEREISRAQRQDTPLSVVIGDVDFFKSINDTYGHPFGDMVLRMVASALRASIRSTDLVARIGGEEFAVLLPGAVRKQAMEVGERLRRAVESMVVMCGQTRVKVTMSFGGATIQHCPMDTSIAKAGFIFVAEADQALYAAKRSGRNRVAWRPKPVDVTSDVLPRTGPGRATPSSAVGSDGSQVASPL